MNDALSCCIPGEPPARRGPRLAFWAAIVAPIGALTAASIWGEFASHTAPGLLVLDIVAGVAALLEHSRDFAPPVVVVLSGGNIDPTLLISVMRHGLTVAGRYLVVRTWIPDRPGELIKLLQLCAEKRVNVVSVEHHREGIQISVAETEVELTVATRDIAHGEEVIAALSDAGFPTERVR